MKTIDLQKEKADLTQIFASARSEPILLLAANGEEYILTLADEFDAEIEALRNSQRFQAFLDERMKCTVRFPLEDIEKEVDDELKGIRGIGDIQISR